LVLVVDHENAEDRAELLAAGCDAVLYTGLPPSEIAKALRTLLEKRMEVSKQSLEIERELYQPQIKDFVSKSPAMGKFMTLVQRVIDRDASLLIVGETGVGKERLARAIHLEGQRKGGTFVAVNCGALPESLLESELFGHEEGAFTGATRARRGCFEMAHRGTIFLDEIGEMPIHLQIRLLRVLQEREIQRVGGEWPIRIDVRVMAATSRDIDDLVIKEKFRSDLLYRLSVVRLNVPPLRERKEDIPELVTSYIKHFARTTGTLVTGITDEAMDSLLGYDWPGNVRELVNVIERATLLCSGEQIGFEDLPEDLALTDSINLAVASNPKGDGKVVFPESWLREPLREAREKLNSYFEKAYLVSLLKANSGRIGETAKIAGITPRALFDKMQRYKLKKEDFKA